MGIRKFWAFIDEGGRRKISSRLSQFIRLAAIAIVFYHVYNALFTVPFSILFRANHVAIFLGLTFLLYSPTKTKSTSPSFVDIILILLAIATTIYVHANAERIIHRWAFSDPVAGSWVCRSR
jgi:TRAP-type uncharacterized transport system fused permease subunit